MAKKQNQERLELWQKRLSDNQSAFENQVAKMDKREALYKGTREVRNAHTGQTDLKEATHVRNIVAELIEAQVDANIPQPKVTARRKEDEPLAKVIEDMLRNELDRMRFEDFNDQQERTVPIQGAGFWLVEWDNSERSHTTVGDVCVSAVHPKQIVPQDGVYKSVADMDFIILKIPQTKEYIRRKYGVTISEESEEEPEIRGSDGESSADDMVTQYVAYYKNDNGGIGLFSWVRETVLEDLEDYQARRLRRCKKCGTVEPFGISSSATGGNPDDKETKNGKKVCPTCGSTQFVDTTEDFEEIYEDKLLPNGMVIEGGTPKIMPDGTVKMVPTKIPYYKPNVFPVIMQKNVSVYGQLLGDSDVDKIADQQNTINWLSTSINDKLMKYGSYLILPRDAKIGTDDKEGKVIRIDKPDWASLINVRDMNIDITQDMAYMEAVYQQARQILGITNSFQGREDPSATSGKAKQFAAQQSAGRLESKRVMKQSAFAQLFQTIFQFKLAYADEPRPVSKEDMKGNREYDNFNRYLFLRRDDAGEYYWNDDFLFSCDTTSSIATNRAAMWQETRLNLQTGAFGNPQDYNTLLLYWNVLEDFHYPYADVLVKFLSDLQQKQMQQQQMMQQQQQMQLQAQQEREDRQRQEDNSRADEERRRTSDEQSREAERQLALEIDRQARADARADAMARRQGV